MYSVTISYFVVLSTTFMALWTLHRASVKLKTLLVCLHGPLDVSKAELFISLSSICIRQNLGWACWTVSILSLWRNQYINFIITSESRLAWLPRWNVTTQQWDVDCRPPLTQHLWAKHIWLQIVLLCRPFSSVSLHRAPFYFCFRPARYKVEWTSSAVRSFSKTMVICYIDVFCLSDILTLMPAHRFMEPRLLSVVNSV